MSIEDELRTCLDYAIKTIESLRTIINGEFDEISDYREKMDVLSINHAHFTETIDNKNTKIEILEAKVKSLEEELKKEVSDGVIKNFNDVRAPHWRSEMEEKRSTLPDDLDIGGEESIIEKCDSPEKLKKREKIANGIIDNVSNILKEMDSNSRKLVEDSDEEKPNSEKFYFGKSSTPGWFDIKDCIRLEIRGRGENTCIVINGGKKGPFGKFFYDSYELALEDYNAFNGLISDKETEEVKADKELMESLDKGRKDSEERNGRFREFNFPKSSNPNWVAIKGDSCVSIEASGNGQCELHLQEAEGKKYLQTFYYDSVEDAWKDKNEFIKIIEGLYE